MSGRSVYLVAYDVADKKRLRHVHGKMRGYGDALQYSVFRCLLSEKERELMVGALLEIIEVDKDRIMIVELGPASGRVDGCVRFLGRPIEQPDDGPVVF
ncbi:MAG: CRISPR-associated endonuclease Cas2 [Candidatus Thermoplasmatota archaeon]